MRLVSSHLGLSLLVLGLAGALVGAGALASPEDDALLPVPGLLRPKPREPAPDGEPGSSAVRGVCEHKPLPAVRDRLPFGPGEAMQWDVTLLGMRTGRVNVRLGERTQIDGELVYPSYASARTEGFLSVLGELDGRMVSWLDPTTQRPVRMVNRFLTASLLSEPTDAREDAAFAVDAQVAGRLVYRTKEKEIARQSKLVGSTDLLDVLSVLYYMRSRTLNAGDPFCFEIYHRRRLWRVTGIVGESKLISAPYMTRRARLLKGELRLVGGGKQNPREVRAWVSEDDDRLPLLVETPDKLGTLQVKLRDWTPGRRLARGGT